jgi:carbon-monoxide dehydrogenase small subunit
MEKHAMRTVQRIWKVNGKLLQLAFPPARRLLDVLREDLHLTGTKESCGEGECGACTILVDGDPVVSCLIPAGQLPNGAEILTIEGLRATSIGEILQDAFVEAGAVQCGFCIPGMIVSSYALLIRQPKPSAAAIRSALAGNLCRCTGYQKIIAAVELAAHRLNSVAP